MNLQELQQAFMKVLIDPNADVHQLLSTIHSSTSLTSQQRLAIYRDSMMESFIKALAGTYPVTLKLVGEDFFRFMAKKYIAQTPSSSPDLGEYGESFPQFIADFESARSVAYLADVAQLEWYYYRVYYGPSSAPFNFQELAAVPANLQPEIIFQLPKNSFLLESKFPISRIWQIHQPDYKGEFSVDFAINIEYLMIYKIDNNVKIILLSLLEWLLLNKIKMNYKLANFNNKQIEVLPEIIARGWVESLF